jgi:hypothetical protein
VGGHSEWEVLTLSPLNLANGEPPEYDGIVSLDDVGNYGGD